MAGAEHKVSTLMSCAQQVVIISIIARLISNTSVIGKPIHGRKHWKAMRKLIVLAMIMASFVGCVGKAPDPVGEYVFNAPGKSLLLAIQVGGTYVLNVSRPGGASYEIHGRWEKDGAENAISFSGIIWREFDPQAGNGFWRVTVSGNPPKICLDGEGISCFVIKTQSVLYPASA